MTSHLLQIDEGVWFHEGPEQLLNARYWIADYSIPRSDYLLQCDFSVYYLLYRARERLQQSREEAKRPGAEKAARTQELHKSLRVTHTHTHTHKHTVSII